MRCSCSPTCWKSAATGGPTNCGGCTAACTTCGCSRRSRFATTAFPGGWPGVCFPSTRSCGVTEPTVSGQFADDGEDFLEVEDLPGLLAVGVEDGVADAGLEAGPE